MSADRVHDEGVHEELPEKPPPAVLREPTPGEKAEQHAQHPALAHHFDTLEQQQEKKFELDTRKRQIALWEHQSLGPDAAYGRGMYHEWLRSLAEISGWSNLTVDLGQQPSATGGRHYVPVPLTLTAEASLEQVARFLAHFDEEQILVLDQLDLREDRLATLTRLFEFAGVDAGFRHPKFEQVRHSTSRKKRATRLGMRVQKMSRSRFGRRIPRRAWLALDVALPLSKPIDRPEGVAEALGDEVLEVLHEDAERLRAQTGRAFEHWSV